MTPRLDEGRKDLLPSRVPPGRVRLGEAPAERQKSEVRSQRSEVRDQRSEDGRVTDLALLTSDF